MAGSVCALAACDNTNPEQPKDESVLTFVAVTKTAWDADTTFTSVVNEKDYSLTYKIALDLKKDNTLKLTGTCQGGNEKTSGGGQNPGGPGGPGGPARSAAVAEEAPEEPEAPAITDWTPYNFTVDGTWTELTGWGYTVKISETTIKVDYNKTEGRHTFYYYLAPTINNKKSDEVLVKLQANDSAYRKTLASDYQTYHIKECTYSLYAFNDNGGNFSRINMYLMPDGTVASYSESGSTVTYDGKGTWSENKTTHTMTITSGGKTYESNDYIAECGYRFAGITAGSGGGPGGGGGSLTGFVSTVANKTSKELTDKDFEGETLLTLAGKDAETQNDYTLEITQNGWAILYDLSGKRTAVCTYTKDNDGNYVITYGNDTFTSSVQDGVLSVNIQFSVTAAGSSGQPGTTTHYDITLSVAVTAE